MARKQTEGKRTSTGLSWTTSTVEETHALAEQLSRLLKPGDVVALHGDLGSGKTTFVQGLAKGIGIADASVKSPTFVLVREYPGAVPVVHIDAYRLSGAPAAAWLDLELLIHPGKITVIEWAERLTELLPDQRIDIQLEHVSTNRRRITLVGQGARGGQLHASLASMVQSPPEAATEEAHGTLSD